MVGLISTIVLSPCDSKFFYTEVPFFFIIETKSHHLATNLENCHGKYHSYYSQNVDDFYMRCLDSSLDSKANKSVDKTVA